MPLEIKELSWDSEFFGFKTGRLEGEPDSTEDLNHKIKEAKDSEYQLLYWNVSRDHPDSIAIATESKLFLADKKATFAYDSLEAISKELPANCRGFSSEDDEEHLISLGIASGIYSRFKIDPLLVPFFEPLYRKWMENSLNRSFADEIIVYDEGGVKGMVTLKKEKDTGHIGLIAVDESARGQGVGKALVDAALTWAKENGCRKAEVVTQLDNEAAVKLYEKAGLSFG